MNVVGKNTILVPSFWGMGISLDLSFFEKKNFLQPDFCWEVLLLNVFYCTPSLLEDLSIFHIHTKQILSGIKESMFLL